MTGPAAAGVSCPASAGGSAAAGCTSAPSAPGSRPLAGLRIHARTAQFHQGRTQGLQRGQVELGLALQAARRPARSPRCPAGEYPVGAHPPGPVSPGCRACGPAGARHGHQRRRRHGQPVYRPAASAWRQLLDEHPVAPPSGRKHLVGVPGPQHLDRRVGRLRCFGDGLHRQARLYGATAQAPVRAGPCA